MKDHLNTFMLFQTYMNLFLLLIKKGVLLRNFLTNNNSNNNNNECIYLL